MSVEVSDARGRPLALRVEHGPDGSARVIVSGEVDMSTSPELGAALKAAERRSPAGTVSVDLDELTFIDSSGLRALLVAGRRALRLDAPWSW